MKRKSKHTAPTQADSKPKKGLDHKRKLDIFGILMIVFAVLLLFAMISHSKADEAVADIRLVDLFRLIGGDPEIQARADLTSNWLGIFGALIAKFFFNATIGYFSIVFPSLLGIWGWYVLRGKQLRILAYYTNYTLVLVLLLSTFFGLLRLISWMPDFSPAWAGNIGDFAGGVISRLIGTTGGVIGILTIILILAVVVVDFNIHVTLDRVKKIAQWVIASVRKKPAAILAKSENNEESVPLISDKEQSSKSVIPAAAPAQKAEHEPKILTVTAEEVFGFSKKTPVSITRPDEGSAIQSRGSTAPPMTQPEGALRSNGIISRESIDGLSAALKNSNVAEVPQEGKKVEEEAVSKTGKATSALKVSSVSAEQTTERREDAPDEILVNDHEKKAVQQAVVKKIMESETNQDADEINARIASERIRYKPPDPELLDPPLNPNAVSNEELHIKADQLKEKLGIFGIEITSINVIPGPVVTQFELVPDSSVKISKIVSLADDLALALAAQGIRIIAPIPGKSAVGVEIPNNAPEIVRFRSVIGSPSIQKVKHHLPLVIGKSIIGEVFSDDLAKMPHLLIAGATGSGKSVGVNVIINSLLFKLHPSEVKFVMIDPKKIEMAQYRGLSRHFLAVCPDVEEEIITDPTNAVIVLKSLELEMDKRYTRLAKAGVRHVNDYNAKIKAGELKNTELIKHYRLPYIVVVIDELADLMITAAREIEEPIARLAQLARAVGIHLIVATQRPSVDVLTGVIKANFSARIAFQVASRIDSRTILDTQGAEQLLGNGDMLYQASGSPKPVRIQNAFLSTAEVERVVEHVAQQDGFFRSYMLPSVKTAKKGQSREESVATDDLIYEAARLVVRHQQGSVSLLQRRLKIGYSRAARIIDQLEIAGIVGPYDGSKAREVLVEGEEQLEQILQYL